MIYKFNIYNYAIDIHDFDISCMVTGTCINNCNFMEYPSDVGICNPCQAGCTAHGCVRPDTDCNLCYDPLCKTCTDFTMASCTDCKPNSTSQGTECKCDDGFVKDQLSSSCISCYIPGCEICTGRHNNDCTCATGFYRQFETDLCLSYCPIGYQSDIGNLVCSNIVSSRSLLVHYVFNQLTNTITDSESHFIGYMGYNDDFYKTFD